MTAFRGLTRVALLLTLVCAISVSAAAQRGRPHSERPPGRETLPDYYTQRQEARDRREREDRQRDATRNAYDAPRSEVSYEPIFPDTPHLVFKVPADVKEGERLHDIRTSMWERRRELERGFDINDITVIAADLTDKPDRQKLYRRKLRWNMPPARLQLAPAMAALAHGAHEPLAAEIRAALRPYRDKTLVIMGHVEGESPTMRWSPDRHPINIEIGLWVELAHSEGVNLLVLGCKSAGTADIGSVNMVNSNALVDKLIGVMLKPPDTFKQFYAGLSGPDHVIAFNPFTENTTYVHARIERPDGSKTWSIGWRPPGKYYTAPRPPPPGAPITSSTDLTALLTAKCDSSARTYKDRNTCLTKARENVSRIDELRQRAENARMAAANIRERAHLTRSAEQGYWRTFAIVTIIIVLLAWLSILFTSWKQQRIDQIDRSPFRPPYREMLEATLWLAGLTAGYGMLLWSGWSVAYIVAILVLGVGAIAIIVSWSIFHEQRQLQVFVVAMDVTGTVIALLCLSSSAYALSGEYRALDKAIAFAEM